MELIQYVGIPDAFMSTLDSNPGLYGFTQPSRTDRNGLLFSKATSLAHQTGRQYITIHCELGSANCPALFKLEPQSSMWDFAVDQNVYTSTRTELRRLKGASLRDVLYLSSCHGSNLH